MPMLEVIHAAETPTAREQKRAFAQQVVALFKDVLGTPDGRLRLFFYDVDRGNCLPGLLEDEHTPASDGIESNTIM